MIIKRIAPMSLAKVSAVLYALLGLIFGACISLISMAGSAFAPKEAAGFGMLFGVGAIIALPIFYGILGFVFSLISAALYNLVAGWVGGIEIDVQ
ncbi:MAG TPA: hypothetical protein VN605_11140 [Thermoanaerobaculia bacterium]|nr:hypothetical protein [Thermoanaerobaculia bacterium]